MCPSKWFYVTFLNWCPFWKYCGLSGNDMPVQFPTASILRIKLWLEASYTVNANQIHTQILKTWGEIYEHQYNNIPCWSWFSNSLTQYIHPSIIYSVDSLKVALGRANNPSWHWARCGVHPRQVAGIVQGQDTETIYSDINTYCQSRVCN